ncbi:hypothetical protein AMATHDRAFT_67963 [Amanita thiersii Skay4041]|uniref:non-specific serine/threonine protein kinase n=1 Tax=Amanita thiersii Skay4041 TaxID=703135 RepID=A0A2A9ND88_9AGAR|nr:hypothetical protein AMATHDRAFT_67963 [Amanita thiersii Skay4041]
MSKYPKINGYQLIQQIGGGGFSTVFKAVNIAEHRIAACKVIQLTPSTTEKERKTIEKEIRIHSAIKHENVLEFLGAAVVEANGKHDYVAGMYMLMELAAGGDLFDKIAPDIGVGDEVAHLFFSQLLAGMTHIHSMGVCHRDLKPENLLLDAVGTLKISDFGLSAVYKLKGTGQTRLLSEKCGSLPYVAPELDRDEAYEAEPIDVWGMGVILYTMLAGNTPWDQPTNRSPEFRLYQSGDIFNELPWNRFSDDALSLLCSMLMVNPKKRVKLLKIIEHPWCSRPSQLASQGMMVIADKLTENLRTTGDLGLASPNLEKSESETSTEVDDDGDTVMESASSRHNSQFTQSLLLFSQTQFGRRYTPHLTRFYASIGPSLLMTFIMEGLDTLGVKYKQGTPRQEGDSEVLRLRIGGRDRRMVTFKGWVEVEKFSYRNYQGSFCVMQRDVGNPISWRQLWKALILSEAVEPHVLRK